MLSIFDSLNRLLALFLSLLFLIPEFFKSNLSCIDGWIGQITHILRDLLVAELMVFVKLNCRVEFLQVLVRPVPLLVLRLFQNSWLLAWSSFGDSRRRWPRFFWSILVLILLHLLLLVYFYCLFNLCIHLWSAFASQESSCQINLLAIVWAFFLNNSTKFEHL